MRLFYSDKDICFRVRVSYENQERMKNYVAPPIAPLFDIRSNLFFSVKFEYETFTCTYQDKKQKFSYKNVRKVEVQEDGVIIFLDNATYISIATEKHEKHNCELFDIVTFLKRRCRRVFFQQAEIQYPDDEDGRYKSNEEPIAQITFQLSNKEIKRMIWYDYLFHERMLTFIVSTVITLLISIITQKFQLLLLPGVITIMTAILTVMFLQEVDGYVKNHQGSLSALLFNNLLVVRLHNTDLELEYRTMQPKKPFFGLWRMKSGNFFVLTFPKRIEEEHTLFFETLYKKIK